MTVQKAVDLLDDVGVRGNIHAALMPFDISNRQAQMFDNSKIDQHPCMLDISNMSEPATVSEMYSALVAVKPSGLSFNEWANRAGVGRSIFADIRKHGNPTQETLRKLLAAIDITPEAFNRGSHRVLTEVAGTGVGSMREVVDQFYAEKPAKRLPVYGSALGGEHGDLDHDIELTELHLSEVHDWLMRPASLAGDPDAYAVTIVGDSMTPRFKPRERVGVSPKAPVYIGDDVIVQLRGLDGEEERIKLVLIKELVKRTASYYELRQYNPDITFRVESKRVAAIHKVAQNFF